MNRSLKQSFLLFFSFESKLVKPLIRFAFAFSLFVMFAGAVQGANKKVKNDKIKTEWFEIVKAPEKVKVDGKLDEWNKTGVHGPFGPDANSLDIYSCKLYGMWDENNLYLGAEVKDPNPMLNIHHNEEGKGCRGWDGDGFIFRIINTSSMGIPVGITRESPQKAKQHVFHVFAWFNHLKNKEFINISNGMGEGTVWMKNPEECEIMYSRFKDNKGYYLEMAIPWKMIRADFPIKEGSKFPFCLELNFSNANTELTKLAFQAREIHSSGTSGVVLDYLNTFAWGGAKLVNQGSGKSLQGSRKDDNSPKMPVKFQTPEKGKVSVVIFNKDGGIVRNLLLGKEMEKGEHTLYWDGKNDEGKVVGAGNYTVKTICGRVRINQDFTIMNSSPVPFMTEDEKGSWGGWREAAAATDSSGNVYQLYISEEGCPSLMKTTLSGQVIWKCHRPAGIGLLHQGGQIALACNDNEVVVAADAKETENLQSRRGFHLCV